MGKQSNSGYRPNMGGMQSYQPGGMQSNFARGLPRWGPGMQGSAMSQQAQQFGGYGMPFGGFGGKGGMRGNPYLPQMPTYQQPEQYSRDQQMNAYQRPDDRQLPHMPPSMLQTDPTRQSNLRPSMFNLPDPGLPSPIAGNDYLHYGQTPPSW